MPTSTEIKMYRDHIFQVVDRIIACLDGLSESELNWRPPAPETNSLYVLAVHVQGNIEANILGTLCGESIERDRDSEFAAVGVSDEPVRERWQRLQERLTSALANLPDSALDEELQHPTRGTETGRELLFFVAHHATEHVGHAELTRQILKAQSD